MGNTCANERDLCIKRSRSNSSALSNEEAYASPPAAPRNSCTPVQSGGSPFLKVDWRMQDITLVALVDEGGSPAVDITKSQDSVREWLSHLEDQDESSIDEELSADAADGLPHPTAYSLEAPPATHYDAEEDKRRGPVVSAVMLRTPTLPTVKRCGVFF